MLPFTITHNYLLFCLVLSFTCYCDEMTPGCSYNKCNVTENGYCHITVTNTTVHAECIHIYDSIIDIFGCMSKENETIYDPRKQKLNFCCKTFAECNKCPPAIAWDHFPNLNSYVRTECVLLFSTPLLTATAVSCKFPCNSFIYIPFISLSIMTILYHPIVLFI